MTREEAILEARRKKEAGEFDRAITGVKPDDLMWDEIALECGHTGVCRRSEIEPTPQNYSCVKCAYVWIEENTNHEHQGK